MTTQAFAPHRCNNCNTSMAVSGVEILYQCPNCGNSEVVAQRYNPPIATLPPPPGQSPAINPSVDLPEPANLKALDSIWFNNNQGVCGIVLGEDTVTGGRRLYAGIANGFDQGADEKTILNWGNKVSAGRLRDMLSRVTEEDFEKAKPGGSLSDIMERIEAGIGENNDSINM